MWISRESSYIRTAEPGVSHFLCVHLVCARKSRSVPRVKANAHTVTEAGTKGQRSLQWDCLLSRRDWAQTRALLFLLVWKKASVCQFTLAHTVRYYWGKDRRSSETCQFFVVHTARVTGKRSLQQREIDLFCCGKKATKQRKLWTKKTSSCLADLKADNNILWTWTYSRISLAF